MAISLGDRLRQVVTGAVPRVAPDALIEFDGEPPPFAPARRTRLDGFKAANVLAGEWIESADGCVLVVDRYYAGNRLHGRQRIGDVVEMLEGGMGALEVLARAWPRRGFGGTEVTSVSDMNGATRVTPSTRGRSGSTEVPRFKPSEGGRDFSRAVETYGPKLCFFDLETTGLAGGAGTQAFLVGCAVLEDGGLRVRQFLLPGFEHERALLSMVAAWIASQGTLVTFNGRSFDVPLIETRYLMHRLACALREMPHLDMLHPARRLWKQRPAIAGPPLDDESCKLSVLERHLAGYHRVGDVPGFEIPSRYFRFVREGDAGPLEAVLEHNRIDLISLALVTARAIRLIEQGPAGAAHPRESLGLGGVFERAGKADDAEACFAHAARHAARTGREPDVRAEALRRLAIVRRRAGRLPEAAAAWQELVSVPGCPSVLRREAREALAIHHEHRSRDLQTARLLVLDVLAENSAMRRREQVEYRLQRLDRKIAVRNTAVQKTGGLIAALEE